MNAEYAAFLADKAYQPPASDVEPHDLHPSLYPFQRAITEWAVRRGRAAIFADCGLGKTRMQIEWARQIGGPALIVAPLAVADQTIAEAAAMGVAVVAADAASGLRIAEPIAITNYERLHRFSPPDYRAVVLDESSILKSVDGKTRTRLIREWSTVPYRLCCTATPAPNDIAELANHAEFLGIMARPEMLATFFVHDEREWRLKGHAEDRFWQWMALWSVYVRSPADLGFSDEGFRLPTLTIRERSVAVQYVPDGELFPALAGGIGGRMAARRASLSERVTAALTEIVGSEEQWLIWCGLNDESHTLTAELRAAGVTVEQVEGADSPDSKIAAERRWRTGEVRVLISKPRIFGFGMNWQHCHRMMFLGLGDSYEQYYQAIRRCWRFGQMEPVDAVIVTSNAESAVVANVRRKEADAARTAASVVEHMRDYERAAVIGSDRSVADYETANCEGDGWRMLLGDSVERLTELADDSVGLSVFSPPFASTDVSNEEWIAWARPVWYNIRESDTLNAAAARTERDDKHIAPLQLGTIERCVRLWSNAGDLVCSPFAGIGSEGFVALRHERRFVGIELKRAYWEQACANLRDAKAQLALELA